MKNILFVIVLLLSVGNIKARQIITGKLIEMGTSNPVESASVELLQLPDSNLVEKVATNSEGSFILYKGDTTKIFCIRIKHVSYKKQIIAVPGKKGNIINMGNINLQPAVVNIKEIVVSGSKILVTELPDKTVYTLPKEIKKTSTDGLDVLRKVPSVQVDYLNENITVEGKSNIVIEVDGVTRNKDYIKKLHPSQIDKLEINTNPSGKYDAETDAVINIVTDPEMRYGLKGMINTALVYKNSDAYMARGNANLDYGLKKISYYITGNYSIFKSQSVSNMQRNTNNISLLHQNSSNYPEYLYGSVNTGFIYDPNELNNFNFNISYNNNSTKTNGNSLNYLSVNNNLQKIYQTLSNSKNNNDGIQSYIFYKHKFDKNGKQNLELELNYYNSLNNISKTEYQTLNYNLDTTFLSADTTKEEKTVTDTRTLTSRTSYFLPFDSVYVFGTGANVNFNHYNIENTSSSSSPNLDYKDFRSSLFAELSRTFKKGNAKIGTRMETSHITINSEENNNYLSVLPYLSGQFKVTSKNTLKFTYSRRVSRPSSSNLNPFVSVIDSQTVSHGNINLKPAYRDYFQFTYSYRFGKDKLSGTISPQVYYEYRTGIIQKISKVIENTNRIEIVPENISNGYEAGSSLAINSQYNKFMFNLYLKYFYSHTDSYLDQINASNKKGFSWNAYVICPLPYKANFMTGIYLTTPTINGQTETKQDPSYMVGLVKQFGTCSLRVLAINPFGNYLNKQTATLRSSSIYQVTDSYMKIKNVIMLNFTYNFKIGKDINRQKANSESESDDNQLKLPF
jgi:hypothetical protein